MYVPPSPLILYLPLAQSPTISSCPSLATEAPMSHHQKFLQRRPPAPWSMEDELALLDAHVEEGNKWAAIAKRMPGGRSHVDVKVRGPPGLDHRHEVRSEVHMLIGGAVSS